MRTLTTASLLSRLRVALKAAAGLLLCAALGSALAAKPYSYYVTGNPAPDPVSLSPASSPSYVLMGGGPDVDQAFRWMVTRAGVKPGTGGRFVIIRATGTDAYDPYIYYSDDALSTSTTIQDGWVGGASMGLSSVETLVIPSVAAANDPFVNRVVARANALFIAGGDQSDYIRFWKNTQLDWTLQRLMAAKVPIGGTSAGLAVLGQFDFAALRGSVTSAQALSDPFSKYMTIDPSPLTLSPTAPGNPGGGFITPHPLFNAVLDAHLDARDRMGRLVAFVARLIAPDGSAGCPGGILAAGPTPTGSSYGDSFARGIGVDVETALLVQGDGDSTDVVATRVTNPSTTTLSAAYFLWPQQEPTRCAAGTPLSMPSVQVTRVDQDNPTFNLSRWWGRNRPYTLNVSNGTLSASGNGGSIY